MADVTVSPASVVDAWEKAAESARRAKENRDQAWSELNRADRHLADARAAEGKAFAALVAIRPEAKP